MSVNGQETVIRVEGLAKRYAFGQRTHGTQTFREMLAGVVAEPWRRLRSKESRQRQDESFWALRDVTFDVRRGEVIGVIGRNGAGKSTLLKILSRITEPTAGYAEIHGRVASLLEVGTGFHPELTGRENIFLNGAILGMKRREIHLKFDEIVAFAGIGEFLDMPVKHYSSGMYVRLAFSVAAHLEPEILVVDEVLSVGDAAFQRMCLGKMDDVAREGRTILFISHDMRAIQRLCSKAILLERGQCVCLGGVEEVIGQYLATVEIPGAHAAVWDQSRTGEFGRKARIASCSLQDDNGRMAEMIKFGEPFSFAITFRGIESVRNVGVVVGINSWMQARITTVLSDFTVDVQAGAEYAATVTLEGLHLNPGRYTLTIGLRQHNHGLDHLEFICPFVVGDVAWTQALASPHAIYFGDVQVPVSRWFLNDRSGGAVSA